MKVSTFFCGATVGLLTGVAAAILTAPSSGKQLRQTVQQSRLQCKTNVCDLSQKLGRVKDAVTTATTEAKNNIPGIINEVKNTFSQFQREIEPTAENLKQEIEALQKSMDEIEKNLSQFKKDPAQPIEND